MQLIGAFDPASAASGLIDLAAVAPNSKVLLYNLSTILIKLDFEDGTTSALHPYEANWWQLQNPSPTLKWSKFDVLASNANPMSTCTVILYDPDEDIIGTYPASLVYLSAISNTVTISQGSVTTLQNDGNSTTNIIESTLLGSTGSNVLVKNDGTVTLAQYIGGVLTDILQTVPNGSSVVKLGNTGLTTEVLGTLKVDQNETVAGTLGVTGNTSLSTVSGSGLATLNSSSITNNETVGGTLTVTGNSSLSTASTSGLATLSSASVTNNETVGGTLGVTGNTSLSTVSTSGLATLNSASVTNNETVGGTLGVTGNTSLSTVSTSGLATLNSASVTNNETVGGTLGVTGNTSLSTLSTSGAATLNSASVTNNETVGGTLGVTGNTSLSTLSTSGLATLNSSSITNNETVGGTFTVTGDATFNGAGTSVKTTNDCKVLGNLIVNQNIDLINGPGTFARLFATIAVGDNDAHIYTNSDNGNLHITASNGTTNIVNFNDTSGMSPQLNVTLLGSKNNKIDSNNIVQGSSFSGSIVSANTNTTFNTNYVTTNGAATSVSVFDNTSSGAPQTFEVFSITNTQVTLRSSGTGAFLGFAQRS